jgi:hypothetical protein
MIDELLTRREAPAFFAARDYWTARSIFVRGLAETRDNLPRSHNCAVDRRKDGIISAADSSYSPEDARERDRLGCHFRIAVMGAEPYEAADRQGTGQRDRQQLRGRC